MIRFSPLLVILHDKRKPSEMNEYCYEVTEIKQRIQKS